MRLAFNHIDHFQKAARLVGFAINPGQHFEKGPDSLTFDSTMLFIFKIKKKSGLWDLQSTTINIFEKKPGTGGLHSIMVNLFKKWSTPPYKPVYKLYLIISTTELNLQTNASKLDSTNLNTTQIDSLHCE